MAARRVNLSYTVAAVVLTLLAAWSTYHLKYAVRDREFELAKLRDRIEVERHAIQLARADLAYLTRPDRLVLQAGALGMVPGRGARIVDPTQIIQAQQLELAREPLPALLPSGAETVLMVKPVPGMTFAQGRMP